MDFLSLFTLLNRGDIRYVLVGGLAALLHGVDRLTSDIDLAVDLGPERATDCIRVLTEAGFKPMLPVDPNGFANPAIRSGWQRDQHMQVFSFWDPTHSRPSIDLFVEEQMPFEELWNGSQIVALDGIDIRVASIEHLIRLKALSGREKDLADIERLRAIQRTHE